MHLEVIFDFRLGINHNDAGVRLKIKGITLGILWWQRRLYGFVGIFCNRSIALYEPTE